MAQESTNEPSILDQLEKAGDLTPIPQSDIERPLVPIAYGLEYRKAMSFFRAITQKHELSERALDLTTFILQCNPSHYTIWNYRSQILAHLHETDPAGEHLKNEMEMLNEQMSDMRKTYQVWQHRSLMVTLLKDPSKEIEFVNQVTKADAKNYHTWTYRQTLLCLYNRPEMWAGELAYTEELLTEDIRNNSAWNHRFFLTFDTIVFHSPNTTQEEFKSIIDREISFAKDQIHKVPNNPSAWNYLRGVVKRGSVALSTLEDFVVPLSKTSQELDASNSWPAGLNKLSNLPVSAAVEMLADIYSESESKVSEALKLYGLLAQKLDPIRQGYWHYRSQRALKPTLAS